MRTAPLPQQAGLDEVPLPLLLVSLYEEGFSGGLTLSREKLGKRFLFRDGVPVFAESTLPSESLGVQLMDTGRIDRPAFTRVVTYVSEHGCKEGKALLDLGLLDAKGLFVALKDQVRIRMLECFGWPRGEYYVDPSGAPAEEAQPFRTDVYRLIQDGLEAHWSPDRFLSGFAPYMELYPMRTKRFDRVLERLQSDDSVIAMATSLDGRLTFWKVVQLARTPRAMAAAWLLEATGALRFRETPAGDSHNDFEADIEVIVSSPEVARAPHTAAARPVPDRENAGAAPAAAALGAEIRERLANLTDADLYDTLGVARDADGAEIKRVYLDAAKTFHPDALAQSGLDAETRSVASQVFTAIGKAYATLSDPAKRADYEASLAVGGAEIDTDALVQAETLFRKGEILIRAGNFNQAIEFLLPAVELWPQEGAYHAAAGWALYKKRPAEPDRALEFLKKGVELDPLDGSSWFHLGVVLRTLGQVEEADAVHERARLLDPSLG